MALLLPIVAALAPILMVPAEMVVVPVYVFVPVTMKVPVPAFVIVPAPLMTPSNCVLVLLASPMVNPPEQMMLPDPDKPATVRNLEAFKVKVAPLFTVKDLMAIGVVLMMGIKVVPLLMTTSVVEVGTTPVLQLVVVAQAVLVVPVQVVCASKGCNCVKDNNTMNIPTQKFEWVGIVTFLDICLKMIYILCFIKVFIKNMNSFKMGCWFCLEY
jgi:hypothetical protein